MSWGDLERLRPEPKFERAQEAQRGVMARVRGLLPAEPPQVMGADELEVLALQLKLESCNLMVAARDLRECEDERRRLAAWREREERRFEWLPEAAAEQTEDIEGRAAA